MCGGRGSAQTGTTPSRGLIQGNEEKNKGEALRNSTMPLLALHKREKYGLRILGDNGPGKRIEGLLQEEGHALKESDKDGLIVAVERGLEKKRM